MLLFRWHFLCDFGHRISSHSLTASHHITSHHIHSVYAPLHFQCLFLSLFISRNPSSCRLSLEFNLSSTRLLSIDCSSSFVLIHFAFFDAQNTLHFMPNTVWIDIELIVLTASLMQCVEWECNEVIWWNMKCHELMDTEWRLDISSISHSILFFLCVIIIIVFSVHVLPYKEWQWTLEQVM